MNPDLALDVVGVGNAIVDVISTVEKFLDQHGLVKGAMTLIDGRPHRSNAMPPVSRRRAARRQHDGRCRQPGGRSTYIGKVRDDQLGRSSPIPAMAAWGLTPFATEGEPTARSLIQVTPDGERTMNTFLGISAFLNPGDIDQEIVESATITYCEEYLWDRDEADAIHHAMAIASDAGRIVVTLSDSFCVDRHRDDGWICSTTASVWSSPSAEVCRCSRPRLRRRSPADRRHDRGADHAEGRSCSRAASGSTFATPSSAGRCHGCR